MDTLHDLLWASTVEVLNFRLKLLKTKPKSPKKADCIDAIKHRYEGRGLEVLWSSLSELQKLATAEACHAFDHQFDPSRFTAKYGDCPQFYNVPESERRGSFYYSPKAEHATLLNLFLFPAGRGPHEVPSDLAVRLSEFVPPPAETEVQTLTEPKPENDLIIRETEHEALADITAMLHLAELGDFNVSEKTGMPSAAGSFKIHECLAGGDFYPQDVAFAPKKWTHEQEIGFIKPVAWAQLLRNAKLLASTGTKSKLSPAGIKALRQPAHEVIRAIWSKWLSNTTFDEFNRINDIKGQSTKKNMTAKPPRREAVLAALSDCPVGKWIDIDAFSNFMVATDCLFDVSQNPWKLYLCEARYGSFGYDGYGGWNILQFRYILVLLFEYAATLGLIDIAYVHPDGARDDFRGQWGADDMKWLSRYDGLRAIRINRLGAYCLALRPDYKPSRSTSSLELAVLPSLKIEVVSGQPTAADHLLLETWAKPMTGLSWCLDDERAISAVERGRSIQDFATFLETSSGQPLPPTVESYFKTRESNGSALQRKADALVFDCRDRETAERLASEKELVNLCFLISKNRLVVPAEHEAKFRKVIRTLGLGIV